MEGLLRVQMSSDSRYRSFMMRRVCAHCCVEFTSRNALFTHLRAIGLVGQTHSRRTEVDLADQAQPGGVPTACARRQRWLPGTDVLVLVLSYASRDVAFASLHVSTVWAIAAVERLCPGIRQLSAREAAAEVRGTSHGRKEGALLEPAAQTNTGKRSRYHRPASGGFAERVGREVATAEKALRAPRSRSVPDGPGVATPRVAEVRRAPARACSRRAPVHVAVGDGEPAKSGEDASSGDEARHALDVELDARRDRILLSAAVLVREQQCRPPYPRSPALHAELAGSVGFVHSIHGASPHAGLRRSRPILGCRHLFSAKYTKRGSVLVSLKRRWASALPSQSMVCSLHVLRMGDGHFTTFSRKTVPKPGLLAEVQLSACEEMGDILLVFVMAAVP
ncbi:hypothetical protein DIPPA_26433 [Diplonema papillatum]|nr:hypothetical protein DIPPA_26433 [Diplonema papillatum]